RVDTKEGPVDWFLGMAVRTADGEVRLSQESYIQQCLRRFGLENAKEKRTPAAPDAVKVLTQAACPEKGSAEANEMRKNDYRGLVGCLLWLAATTRPDISWVVQRLSRFVDNPGVVHWAAARRVLRYLKGTMAKEMVFRRQEGGLRLIAYTDADWATDSETRRSVTGVAIMLAESGPAVQARTKGQSTVALSSTEAEYVASATGAQDVVYLTMLLTELGLDQHVGLPATMRVDNESALRLIDKPGAHDRTKHVSLRHRFIAELVKSGGLKVEHVGTGEQVADVLTKPLGRELFEKFAPVLLGHKPAVGNWSRVTAGPKAVAKPDGSVNAVGTDGAFGATCDRRGAVGGPVGTQVRWADRAKACTGGGRANHHPVRPGSAKTLMGGGGCRKTNYGCATPEAKVAGRAGPSSQSCERCPVHGQHGRLHGGAGGQGRRLNYPKGGIPVKNYMVAAGQGRVPDEPAGLGRRAMKGLAGMM
ncbi:MAG TPA: Ty1/Copia family ribonuclease HI, partial [Burkholderiaceae bacterium]|nr:Ty1/Copia family ribonuclease HI [Burkholderiaceae bacterium]